MNCACGGRLLALDVTGYYPYAPHKCQVCGAVEYLKVNERGRIQGAKDDRRTNLQSSAR